jgi:hypothetical protein
MQSRTTSISSLLHVGRHQLRSILFISPILLSTACLTDTTSSPLLQFRVHGTVTVEGTGKPASAVSLVVYDDYFSLNAPIARGTTGANGVYDISFKGQCRANATYSVLANSGLGAATGESLFKSFACIDGGGELNFVVTPGSAGPGS